MNLFESLRPGWAQHEHPVFDLETRRRMDNRSLMAMRWGCLPAIFAITGLTILSLSVAMVVGGVFWDLEQGMLALLWSVEVSMWLIQIIAGAIVNILVIAQTTPSISGEIELQSWRLLRTTTLPLRDIIFSKLAAVLDHLRMPFAGLVILRGISVTTVFFLTAYMFRQAFYHMSPVERTRFWLDGLWIPVTAAGLLLLFFYASQPLVQFALNGVLAMLASAYSPSRSRAMAAGLVGRLTGWVGSIVFNIGSLFFLGFIIFANWADPRYAPIRFFRQFSTPSDLAVAWVASLVGIIYILVLLGMQLGFIAIGLRLTIRRAGRIGA